MQQYKLNLGKYLEWTPNHINIIRRSTSSFHKNLKTYIFNIAFPPPLWWSHFLMTTFPGPCFVITVYESDLMCCWGWAHSDLSPVEDFNIKHIALYYKAINDIWGRNVGYSTMKRQEKRIEVNEMTVLQWTCGLTRKDKIRNEHIWGTTRVTHASKKITERPWTIELVRACDEERWRTHTGESVKDRMYQGKGWEKTTENKMERHVPTRHGK